MTSLWGGVLLGVLEECSRSRGRPTEELVSSVLQQVLKGLRSRVGDYQAAALMVVGQLAARVGDLVLEEKPLVSIVEAVAKVHVRT